MKRLGSLAKKPIRSIWKKEPEFSAWLAEDNNIALLGEAIGVDILAEETEAGVGDFSADILAKEDGGNRLVIIENQFGNTNHDHLGKLITYAAGREAKVLIWVVEDARDEHRAAIQWLNDNTPADIGFFLVQIEIYVIGESLPAPKFTVLESPNDWIKSTRQNTHLSEREVKQGAWWAAFMDYAMDQAGFRKLFNRIATRPQHFLDLPMGTSQCHISLTITKKHLGVELYIPQNKELFNSLSEHKDEIEKALGFKMDWFELQEKKASRIITELPGDFREIVENKEFFNWYCEKAIAVRTVFAPYIKQLAE